MRGNPQSLSWKPVDCVRCSVPAILYANASPDLELTLTIKPRLLGLGRTAIIEARCARHRTQLEDPYLGCPECSADRPGLDVFRRALGSEDDD